MTRLPSPKGFSDCHTRHFTSSPSKADISVPVYQVQFRFRRVEFEFGTKFIKSRGARLIHASDNKMEGIFEEHETIEEKFSKLIDFTTSLLDRQKEEDDKWEKSER